MFRRPLWLGLRKEHGEDLWQMPSKELRLVEDERIFIERLDERAGSGFPLESMNS